MLQNNQRINSYTKRQENKLICINSLINKMRKNIINTAISRIRTGPETIIMVPDIARGGNWLYEWMRAELYTNKNQAPAFLIHTPGMEGWLDEFPNLDKYTRPASARRFKSLRAAGFGQDIEGLFSHSDLKNFIENNLLSLSFERRRAKAKQLVNINTLVINVRRGDYYTSPTIHKMFGIDTVTYIRAAIAQAIEINIPSNIVVVSDDLKWCRQNLSFLSDVAPTRFDKFGEDMFDDLALLSVAHRLILTNTTFGYWGAYIANINYDAEIYAPSQHQDARSSSYHMRKIPMQHQHNWVQINPPHGWTSWLETDKPE